MFERRPRILVIDDDESWLNQAQLLFDSELYEIDCYATLSQGLAAFESFFYDIVLLDLNFDGESQDGLDGFKQIHALNRGADVIVVSGETNPARIVDLVNAGVSKFIPKLHSSAAFILEQVDKVLADRKCRMGAYDALLKDQVGESILGFSPMVRKMREDIERIAKSGIQDVLILGETGTGKELVARALSHIANPTKPIVTVHCGAIADSLSESEFFGHAKGSFTGANSDRIGAFELAKGGSVFLDEIGEMPLHQQTRLLRVLQERKIVRLGSSEERPVNFRCIAATHVDLKAAVQKGTFREDLYYRVAKEVIHVPPLRDRPEDVPQLIHYFVAKAGFKGRKSISLEAINLLQNHAWPGNIRQLRAAVESILTRTTETVVREKDVVAVLPELAQLRLPAINRSGANAYGQTLVMNEKLRFEKAIIQAHGNRADAAKLLGISRATFFRRAKELGMVRERGTLQI